MTTRPVAKQRGGASNHIIADNTRSGRWRQAFSAALRSGRVDVAHGVLLLRITCPSAALPFHSVGARQSMPFLSRMGASSAASSRRRQPTAPATGSPKLIGVAM